MRTPTHPWMTAGGHEPRAGRRGTTARGIGDRRCVVLASTTLVILVALAALAAPAALGAAALGTAVATAVVAEAGAPAGHPAAEGWTEVWRDDFTGPAGSRVDTANWLYDTGHCYPGCPAANWGTGEVETMTDSTTNVRLDGAGRLMITPVRDTSGNWTSGRIETRRTDFAAPPGGVLRIEGRLQVPNVTGAAAQGYWPAFWSLGAPFRGVYTNWPRVGEIDIMENVNGVNTVYGTLHCGVAIGGPCNETTGLGGSRAMGSPSAQAALHTYAVEYDRGVTPEQLRWYADGVVYHTLRATQVDAATWSDATNHGFFVILNVAIGGGWPGAATPSTASGVPMIVDYVSVSTRGGVTTPSPSGQPTRSATSTPPGGTGAYATIQAEEFSEQSGARLEACTDTGGGQDVGSLGNGDWLRYDGVDFGAATARGFSARVASGADTGISGLVEVRLDSRSNAPIGSFSIANTGGWQRWRTVPANIAAVTGTHTVYLTFTSGQPSEYVNINWFTFTT